MYNRKKRIRESKSIFLLQHLRRGKRLPQVASLSSATCSLAGTASLTLSAVVVVLESHTATLAVVAIILADSSMRTMVIGPHDVSVVVCVVMCAHGVCGLNVMLLVELLADQLALRSLRVASDMHIVGSVELRVTIVVNASKLNLRSSVAAVVPTFLIDKLVRDAVANEVHIAIGCSGADSPAGVLVEDGVAELHTSGHRPVHSSSKRTRVRHSALNRVSLVGSHWGGRMAVADGNTLGVLIDQESNLHGTNIQDGGSREGFGVSTDDQCPIVQAQ